MKWVLSHATDEFHHWLLQQEENTRSLTLNLPRLSLRLNGFSKRLFFLQVHGLLQKKVLLCSEYGITIGEAGLAEKPSAASFILNEQKLFFEADEEHLLLFDSDKILIGECGITAITLLDKLEFYALLFGFAWFLTADAVPAVTSYEVFETS